MIIDSVAFKGHRCFKDAWAGFETLKPVNVIIGRNNTGKSHLLDLIAALCKGAPFEKHWSIRFGGVLDEACLRSVFPENNYLGGFQGDPWRDHGRIFVNERINWEIDANGHASKLLFRNSFDLSNQHDPASTQNRRQMLADILRNMSHPLSGLIFRRLFAERNLGAETAGVTLALGPDGHGGSNIIRRYLVTSNEKFPREVVQKDLLAALNEVFGPDGQFTEIDIRVHDEAVEPGTEPLWEVYLGEAKKGLIQLSRSGSGLKTVILVLLNLLVVPHFEQKPKSRYVFAFEELENYLHPALLRRLLRFVEQYAVTEKAAIFLTTHSSAALDVFSASNDAQIIHVTHDGEAARVATVSAHFERLDVVAQLGAKPSDLLQANGIIWVEGPSDRVYLNRWLELYAGKRLREGRDYQCAFYGGSLLARAQFTSPEEEDCELVNLLNINPNVIVVCDGDRTADNVPIKERVRKIQAQVKKIPGAHIWTTAAKEIENYTPGSVLQSALGIDSVPDPGQYERFFPGERDGSDSFIQTKLDRRTMDKMELALCSAPFMDKEKMKSRFDWEKEMEQIVERIDKWNRI